MGAEDQDALAFDGVDDHVAVPMTPRYEFDDPFTWEVVSQFNPSEAAIQTMLGLERTNNGELKISRWDDASPESDVFASSRTDDYGESTGRNILYSNAEYVDTGWHAYALVRDVALGEYRLYVDRVLADICSFNDVDVINGDLVPLAIGAQFHNDYVDQCFTGEIAEVRISDVALAVDELLEAIVSEAVVASFTQDVDAGPAPLTVHFSSTSTGTITGYAWDFGDGTTSDEADPTHTFVAEGIYTVTLTVTNSGGSDTATETIYVLGPAPQIIAIRDVPDDQGRWVYVDFARSMHDTDGLALSEMYTVQREDDSQWVSASSVGAYGELIYTAVVPTQGDGDLWLTSFRVIAHMDEGNWASATVEGSSEDNITPTPPEDIYWVSYIHLAWSAVAAPDLVGYRIYGSNNPTFADDAEFLFDAPYPEYEFTPPHEWAYYFVTAVDDAGLESDPSEPRIPLSAEDGIPNAFTLANYPNPFNPQTTIVCTLPQAGAVRLRVYDVAGRLVRALVDEDRPQGRFEVNWDGRNDRGQAVASGAYIYRLESAKQVLTRRMLLVR